MDPPPRPTYPSHAPNACLPAAEEEVSRAPEPEGEALCYYDPANSMVLGMEAEAGWQSQSALQLLGPSCGLWGPAQESCLPLDQVQDMDRSAPVATFNLSDINQQCIAQNLRGFLTGVNFDQANQQIHPRTYGVSPVYDNHLSAHDLDRRFAQHPDLSSRQRMALGFFMYGEAMTAEQTEELFSGQIALFQQMRDSGLISANEVGGEIAYRLNNLTLVSHQLPNDEVIYLFADLPRRLRSFGSTAPTAQVSETSYILLNRLEQSFEENGASQFHGVMADFGSGTGILAIALLRMYPNLDQGLAVEIDPQSMNLSRFNAMLNGVEDRFAVVDNSQEGNFYQALGIRPLNLAVSNPPFNAVPRSFAEEFTDFGDGGPQGLDVTSIFLRQALPVLAEGAPFIAYSHLALNGQGEYCLTRHLNQEGFTGHRLDYEDLNFPYLQIDAQTYSQSLANYLMDQRYRAQGLIRPLTPDGQEREVAQKLLRELQKEGIQRFEPRIWSITPQPGISGIQVSQSATSLPDLERHYGHRIQAPSGRGGVYRELHIERPQPLRGGIYEELRQIQTPRRGGVYLKFQEFPQLRREALEEGLREYLREQRPEQ